MLFLASCLCSCSFGIILFWEARITSTPLHFSADTSIYWLFIVLLIYSNKSVITWLIILFAVFYDLIILIWNIQIILAYSNEKSTTWNGKLAKCGKMFWYTYLYILLGCVNLHLYQTCVIFCILTTAECRGNGSICFVMDLHLPLWKGGSWAFNNSPMPVILWHVCFLYIKKI